MNLLPLIVAKRRGEALSAAAIDAFVAAVSDGSAPDYQISALLMAIVFQGMTEAETTALTRAMAASGEQHDWSTLPRPTVDKHSTGGVGDKLSLVLAPLVACLGAAVPMLSGRGLGFTGGTLDKLESVPGLATRLDTARFRRLVETLGCAFIGQSEGIAPADRRLYALRDVTGTVESLPLIVSSILSKKIAAGPSALVIDLKVGRGAFMPDLEAARALGAALRHTAGAFGRRCEVVYTRMDAPLGRAVGNRPELLEAIQLLRGQGPATLRELVLALAVPMLRLARGGDPNALAAECDAALDDGRALARFAEVLAAQGGRMDVTRDDAGLPAPAATEILRAAADGVLPAPDARVVGELCVALGAGRARAEDAVDPAAGIVFLEDWGAPVRAGQAIARVEASDASRAARCAEALAPLLTPDPVAAPAPAPLLGVEDERGFRALGRLSELLGGMGR
ncbi:MAG: thymidine phosphorylase [Candidatus Latescibacteria bacterium]|nr:thymidine phosphorylase [Candidatus Latescibacterota bacterium]